MDFYRSAKLIRAFCTELLTSNESPILPSSSFFFYKRCIPKNMSMLLVSTVTDGSSLQPPTGLEYEEMRELIQVVIQ